MHGNIHEEIKVRGIQSKMLGLRLKDVIRNKILFLLLKLNPNLLQQRVTENLDRHRWDVPEQIDEDVQQFFSDVNV